MLPGQTFILFTFICGLHQGDILQRISSSTKACGPFQVVTTFLVIHFLNPGLDPTSKVDTDFLVYATIKSDAP